MEATIGSILSSKIVYYKKENRDWTENIILKDESRR